MKIRSFQDLSETLYGFSELIRKNRIVSLGMSELVMKPTFKKDMVESARRASAS